MSDAKFVMLCNLFIKASFVGGACFMVYHNCYKLAFVAVVCGLMAGSDYSQKITPKKEEE